MPEAYHLRAEPHDTDSAQKYSRTFTLEDPSCTSPGCPFKWAGLPGGCTASAGILSYREIEEVLAGSNIEPTYDKTDAVKYFTWNHNQWAAYDDEQTFQQKIKYANNQGLGGLLIWAIDQDDSNLDALRGVIYPKNLTVGNPTDDVNYWNNQQPGTCETTACGGSCSPGTIEITTVACPKGGKHAQPQKLCCPIASAPNPSTCHWRGGPGLCNGQCHGGEVALASSVDGGNGHCRDGRQFYVSCSNTTACWLSCTELTLLRLRSAVQSQKLPMVAASTVAGKINALLTRL